MVLELKGAATASVAAKSDTIAKYFILLVIARDLFLLVFWILMFLTGGTRRWRSEERYIELCDSKHE